MKFVVWIACVLAFAAQAVARDGAVRPASNSHTPNSVHSASGDDTCGDGIVNSGEGVVWNQIAKAVASDAASNDQFGYSVSVDGDTVVVGAFFDDERGTGSGSAYVFERDVGGADAWGQVAKLTASDAAAGDFFGYSVSVSGDTVVVGATGDDDAGSRSGSVYVFERNVGGADAWGQVAKLTASDAATDDRFGSSVSVSGDTVVVGALFDYDGGSASGSAYVFERNAGAPGAWGQVAKLTASDAAGDDRFGFSVSVSGDTVVVGALFGGDAGTSSGSAYVFERNVGGADAWGQVAKLTASDTAANDGFGRSVSVSGDTVVAGAYSDDDAGSRSGSAYVFERNAGGNVWGQVAKLTASDAAAGDEFGSSVAVSGETVVVGARFSDDAGSDSGSAYVFDRNVVGADAWGQSEKLTASDAAASDRFGWSISVSGDTVVVGATLDDDAVSDSGSAYILTRGEECDDGTANSDTIPDACRTDCTLPGCGDDVTDSGEACDDGASNSDTAPDACRTDCTFPACGDGVTDTGEECDDGNTDDGDGCGATCQNECGDGIQEAPEECDDGAANSDTLPDACRTDCTLPGCGDDITDSGEACDDGASNSDTAPDACRTDCTFPACGDGVTDTDTGEECDDGNTDDGDGCGATCQNEFCGDGIVNGACEWNPIAKPVAPDAAFDDFFGVSVSVSGDTAVVGAPGDDDEGSSSGSVYVLERNVGGADAWGQVAKLTASDATSDDYFGTSVSVSGDTVVVGARRDDAGPPGSAYVFERNAGGADAWGQVATLTASDAVAGDQFGISVSVSGDTVVVGAYADDDAGFYSGSAYVFERNVGGADAWSQAAKLTASDGSDYDWFGYSVSVGGDTVVVGARNNDSAYVFERNMGGTDAWGQAATLIAFDVSDEEFGVSVSVSGDTVVVGGGNTAPSDEPGFAYVFERNAGGADAWGQVATLTASDAAADDPFGFSVSVRGDTVVVGARHDDDAGFSSGSAYVFERNAGGADAWGEVAKLTASDADAYDYFGTSVSAGGDTIAVGAPGDDDAGTTSGSAYILTTVCDECDDGAANSDTLPDACRTDCTLPGCGDDVTDSGEACDDGAGNSNTAPDACRTDCTFPACGDGATDTGEECDDGNTDDGDGCDATCQNECGDDIQQAHEECDDGTANSDTLPDACRTDCKLPGCGDDVTDSGEACDDGTSNSDTTPDACRTDCTFPACGDGATDTGEECDDGNNDDGDGCNATCQNECGDGIQQAHEECDEGTANSDTLPDACRTDCKLPGCGDDVTDSGEACDDGASNSDTAPDACRTDCTFPACGDGATDTGEECDDGNTDDGDGCGATCRNECGDDIQQAHEECDDGTANSDTLPDACRTDCTLPGCGDDVTDSGEACDDGASNSDTAPDACRTDCTSPACGDGATDTGEECDDGNTDDGDGCGATCHRECGDDTEEWNQFAKLTASDAAGDDRFGSSVSASGDTVVVGAGSDDDTATNSGSAYVFERNAGGNVWGQVAKLFASDAAAGDGLGSSVSVSGDMAVVGATGDDEGGGYSGSVYVFERNVGGADAWGQVAKLTAFDASAEDFFGGDVSVSGDTVVVGAIGDDDAGSRSGSVYVFERNEGGADAWGLVAKLTASDAAAGDYFGSSVSVSGNTVVVGARLGDDAGSESGSAYVFERNVGGADAWGQVAKLRAFDARPDDRFGVSVSVSGDTVVVGAYFKASAYVFQRNVGGAEAWGQVAKLTPSDVTAHAEFGISVSVSGDTVVVGADYDDGAGSDSGSAFVFERNVGGADAWGEVAKLTAFDAAANDYFGRSVSLSDDTVVVGAHRNDDAGSDSGSAYIWALGCVNCGDDIQEALEECDDGTANSDTLPDACRTDCTLPGCGDDVTDSGEACDDGASNSDTVPDACRTDCTFPACGDGVTDSGEACDDGASNSDTAPDACRTDCTFPACGDGGTDTGEECDDGNNDDGDGCDATCQNECGNDIEEWNQFAKSVASDTAAGDNFGVSVSVSGDTMVVGATDDDDAGSRSGSAYVFERNVSGADAWGQVAKLTASDAAVFALFGSSVSISGDTIVVGADRDELVSGSAYVFERNAGGADAWGQVAKLTASDAAAGDYFGSSVSVSGDTIVVGAHSDDDAGSVSGSAYVFERNAGGADAWGQAAKLTASDAASGDIFGSSVSVSGDTVVVSAPGDDDAGSSSGSAYVFERNVGGVDAWGQVAKLTAFDAGLQDRFGTSISVSGDTVVVGAYTDDAPTYNSGSAYVFERNGGGVDAWGHVAKLTASDAAFEDRFGGSVSVSGDRVVVGANSNNDAGPNSGSAYVFERNTGGADAWGEVAKLTAFDAAASDYFGTSVSLSDDTAAVGAYRNDDAGSAYIWESRCVACGDDVREALEECDDGTDNSDTLPDACRTDCTLPSCGDDVTDSGEACDDGASNSDTAPDACRTDCTYPACGDGVTDTGEECDDGNNDDGDGCNATCQIQICGDDIQVAPEECDDGTANSDTLPDACRTDCRLPSCGDDVTDSGEACDAGASNSDTVPDACRTDCTFPVCGDGVTDTDTGEECDDGNNDDGDGCNATCQNEFCGDGIVNNSDCESFQIARPVASDAALDDFFGVSVSVSGDTAVVGAPGDDDAGSSSGSVYVLERNVGGADAWGQVAKLTASDAVANDYFGTSVSVSGDTVVVGARRDDAGPPGSAYVFERNAGGADAWGQVATLTASDAVANDQFGISVSVSGDTVVVGAYADDDAGFYSGSAYVFERNVGGADAWGQAAKLTASDGSDYDWFGYSVSVSGDTVVVGARNNDSAYVFERNMGGTDAWGQAATLIASDAGDGEFVVSVSVSGDTVVVGGGNTNPLDGPDPGFAYVFERNVGGADAWGQVAKLTASDAAADDLFGSSVSVSGDTVVVGARHDDDAGSSSGSAYVFERNVGGADAWGEVVKLTVSDADAYDYFGTSVSVGGDTIAVGAPGDDDAGSTSGSAYILTYGCEECDDGNTADGDGCSSTCQTEMGPNLIASGGFEQREPWGFFTNGIGMFQVAGEEAVVTIRNSGSNTQLFQRFGGLVAGTYKLDFDVKSSVVTRARTILVNETDLSWIAQAGFRARPAWSHVTSTLVVPADVPPGMANTRLSFYMPGVPNGTTLHFDNVVLKRVGPN